ncbi:hypothetical protein OK016_10525 [Vibrio chagasii]|nr:hypothetical protein [Vibrio chagasii]
MVDGIERLLGGLAIVTFAGIAIFAKNLIANTA